MMIKLRRGKRAQSLVIVALSATALFGIIALGLDAGRLYFQRRDVQNAADAGALAGAQELIPTGVTTSPTSGMQASAACQAAIYAFKAILDVPQAGTSCSPVPGAYFAGAPGAAVTEPAANISANVQIWTPSRNNNNEIHVRVTYNVPLTFASVIGFTTSAVVADAYAHAGFYNKTYTVFGFDAGGNGNSVNYDQNGNAQIDDGYNGSDICAPSATQGRLVSNAKWHAPNPGGSWMNLNGQFFYSQGADTHALVTYWYGSVATSQPVEQSPNYEPPLKPALAPPPGSGTLNGKLLHIYYPGTYISSVNLTNNSDYYRFMNGIYYFQDANFNISGGTISNTSDGGTHYGPYGGVSDLPAAADGTNGVEFVFDGDSSFNASTSGNTSPSVFFTAPSFVSSGTDSLVFFIKATDTISGPTGSPWVEQIDGTKSTAGGFPFQIWGSIFNADQNGSHGTVTALRATSTSRYAVTGEMVSPQVDLDGGGLAGTTGSYTPSTPGPGTPPNPCSTAGYQANTAGYLVQFNSHYVPHFRGYAYLVK